MGIKAERINELNVQSLENEMTNISSSNIETIKAERINELNLQSLQNEMTNIITSSNEDMTVNKGDEPATYVETMATGSDIKIDDSNEEVNSPGNKVDAMASESKDMISKNTNEVSTKNERTNTESNSKMDLETGDLNSTGNEEINDDNSNAVPVPKSAAPLDQDCFVTGKSRQLLEMWQIMIDGQESSVEKEKEDITPHLTEQMLAVHDQNQREKEEYPINIYIPEQIPEKDLEVGEPTMMTKAHASSDSANAKIRVVIVTALVLVTCVVSALIFLNIETYLN